MEQRQESVIYVIVKDKNEILGYCEQDPFSALKTAVDKWIQTDVRPSAEVYRCETSTVIKLYIKNSSTEKSGQTSIFEAIKTNIIYS